MIQTFGNSAAIRIKPEVEPGFILVPSWNLTAKSGEDLCRKRREGAASTCKVLP
jgi:hypothetical protein